MLNLVIIFMSIVLVNNFLLSQFLGICSFLGAVSYTHLDVYKRQVNSLRIALGKDSIDSKSILTLAREAIDSADFDAASRYELLIQEKIEELRGAYSTYIKNLF